MVHDIAVHNRGSPTAKRWRAARVAVLLSLIWCLAEGTAQALHLSPPVSLVTARPGEKVRVVLSVSNPQEMPVEVRVSSADLQVDPQGRARPASAPTERSCARWVAFDLPRFTLKPNQGRKVYASMTVPPGASGGYYALLQFYVLPTSPSPAGGGISIALGAQVSSALLVAVRGRRVNAKIGAVEMHLTSGQPARPLGLAAAKPWMATVRVVNTGNMHVTVEGDVAIADATGRIVDSAPLHAGRGFVLPGFPRDFTAQGRRSLADGQYVVNAALRFAQGRARASATDMFVVADGLAKVGRPSPQALAVIEAISPEFDVEPGTVVCEVPPGGRRTQAIRLRNATEKPVTLQTSLVPWDQSPDGAVRFPKGSPSHGRDCCAWMSVMPTALTIPPRREGRVTLTVTAPRDMKPGEHYGAVAFSKAGASLPSDPSLLRRRAVLAVVTKPRSAKPDAQISDARVGRTNGGAWEFTVAIRNTGNTRCFARGRISVSSADGKALGESLTFGGAEESIVPNAARVFTVEWPRVLTRGNYRALVSVDFADGRQPTTRVVALTVK